VEIEGLFAAHYRGLTRVAYRVVGETGLAEEVAAEAFWRLHRRPPATNGNVAGWLYRTVLRLALDQLKMRGRRVHYEGLAPRAENGASPEEALFGAELQARVRVVLSALKAEQASLLVLRSEGYTLAEAATLLNLNPKSMGTFASRADAAFREEYVRRYGES
jgi:RNA polymerase sigma factor (sigma-70 family)